MKMTSYYSEYEIPIQDKKGNLFHLKDKKDYQEWIQLLFKWEYCKNQEESGVHFLKDEIESYSDAKICWINDPYHFSYPNSKMMDGINQYLSQNDKISMELIHEVSTSLLKLASIVEDEVPISLTYESEYSLKTLLNMLKFKVDMKLNSVEELYYQIIDTNHITQLYDLIIITNYENYLEDDKLTFILEYCDQLEETVLFLSYKTEEPMIIYDQSREMLEHELFL